MKAYITDVEGKEYLVESSEMVMASGSLYVKVGFGQDIKSLDGYPFIVSKTNYDYQTHPEFNFSVMFKDC